MRGPLEIGPGRWVPAHAIDVSTARSSGPGGQHVNTTESKVLLVVDTTALPFLDDGARARLRAAAGSRLDDQGRLHVVAQAHRDQLRNLEDARARAAELLAACLVRPKRRVPTKKSKGSERRRLEGKAITSRKKAARRPVRDE